MTRWPAALSHVVMMASRWSASNVRHATAGGAHSSLCTTCTIAPMSPRGGELSNVARGGCLERIHPALTSDVQETICYSTVMTPRMFIARCGVQT